MAFGIGKSSSKDIQFFCENCDTEVPRDAKTCPTCGRVFASVLCPSCGFAGAEALFKDGCPACGYSIGAGFGDTRGSRKKGADAKGFRDNKNPDVPLPVWVYVLTTAAFTGIIAALFFAVF
jgi:predicted RNA-binding Zn-ribbon protein involved in translation (DUF1610 family)